MAEIKICPNCGETLDRIVFTHTMSEEWMLNGETWELSGRNSLVHDPHLDVHCSECDAIVGKGTDFGF